MRILKLAPVVIVHWELSCVTPGVRVPFLRVGWNRQFVMMQEFGFVYDSSVTAPYSKVPYWPYTLDYRIPHKCVGEGVKCPSRPFKGIWEMVMNQIKVGVS